MLKKNFKLIHKNDPTDHMNFGVNIYLSTNESFNKNIKV